VGLIGSDAERKALIALAEGVPGVTQVVDEMIPAYGRRVSRSAVVPPRSRDRGRA
jgi:hypothetical protein